MYEPLVTAGSPAAPRRFPGRLNVWERAPLGVGSAAGGLLGCCWIPHCEKRWPHWAAARWGPAVPFSVGSAGAGDTQGTAGPVLCQGATRSASPCRPVARVGRNEPAKRCGDGIGGSSPRSLCLKSARRRLCLLLPESFLVR